MKDNTSLGKTITFQYSKSNITNIVKLALIKAFTSGLGLDAMSLAWPTVVQLAVVYNSGLQWGISQEYSFVVSSQ